MSITIRVRTLDGFTRSAKYATLAGARRRAHKHVGETPEISETFGYAVSGDGMCKVTWVGCVASDLFPKLTKALSDEPDDLEYGDSRYADDLARRQEDFNSRFEEGEAQ